MELPRKGPEKFGEIRGQREEFEEFGVTNSESEYKFEKLQ